MRETSHGSSRTRVYGAATALAGVLYVTICIAAASLIAGCRPAMPSALAPSAERIRTGHSSEGLFYESSGGGEPLVLIHGFSLDRRMWDPQVEVWQDEYHVLRYDLRGHGRSAPPVQPYSAHEDLRQLLDELGIERPTLIGLSAGSEVAINFAISYPDRVERLVLAAPGLSGYALPPMPWFRPVAEALSAGEPERAARLWAHTPIMTLFANKEAEEQLHGIVRDNWRVWTYSRLEQPFTPPAVDRLSAIACPVLVVVGDQDQQHIIDIGRLIADRIAGAMLGSIPGAGHIVNLDAPHRFNAVVESFLRHD